MSTKKKRKPRKPMRLWLVREEDSERSYVWFVMSRGTPWLWKHGDGAWLPWSGRTRLQETAGIAYGYKHNLAPGECVELREVR